MEDREAAESILIIGAGVFGLSTAYSLLTNPRYDRTKITILDSWTPESEGKGDKTKSTAVTPASIDNSRIIRPDYASKPYARLASLAQHEWRKGWPHTLPTGKLHESRLPLNPSCERRWAAKTYRESGLLLTRCEHREGLNPKAGYYLDGSLENIFEMAKDDLSLRGRVDKLSSTTELTEALGTGKLPGDYGYLNRASGWADSGAAISILKDRTRTIIQGRAAEGKAEAVFLNGPGALVKSLIFSTDSSSSASIAKGATLVSGQTIHADLTILAAGAWSSKLLPMSLATRVKATGQALGYVVISAAEAERLAHIPVPLDLSLGLFLFPPIPMNDGSGRYIIKMARHGWGYAYEETVPNTEPHGSEDPDAISVSFPAPDSGDKIAAEASPVLLDLMHRLGAGAAQTLHVARTCWYSDTATCDWIMDYAPRYNKTLFVATGGSGHGFKFAPVLGDWVVKAIEGRLGRGSEASAESDLGAMLARSWRWRSDGEDQKAWQDEGDGSRGGPKGMWWTEEIAKGEDGGTGIPAIE